MRSVCGVLPCVCVVNVQECVGMYSHGHPLRSQGILSCVFLYCSHCLETGLSLTGSLPFQRGWLARDLLESPCLHPPSGAGLQACGSIPGLSVGTENLNSGPHAFRAGALTH